MQNDNEHSQENNLDDDNTENISCDESLSGNVDETAEAESDNADDEIDFADDYDFDEEDDFAVSDEYASDEHVSNQYEYNEENDIKPQKKPRMLWKKIKIPFLSVIGVILCAFIAAFLYANSTITSDRVMKNVYIEGIDVGGLTYDETVALINSSQILGDSEITLKSGDKQYVIKSSEVGMSAIPEETAQRAIEYCKTGNIFTNCMDAFKLLFSSHEITPAPQVDTAMLDQKISEFGNIVLGELKQHYIVLNDDGTVTLNHGQSGYGGDTSTVREQILTAFKTDNLNTIYVDYSECLTNPDEMTIQAFDALVYKDPVDARYDVDGNTVNIIPGDTGRYIDKSEAEPLLAQFAQSGNSVNIPFYVSQPDINSQELSDKLFSGTLGSFSTSYSSSTSNRCANIARAASLINGTVVAPGATFSFNNTVGHRTTANGFYTAKEYVDGKSVDGIGGGTCQVSSTLYSAVLYADMSIVERLNHMMTVGYIPLGQDATVSDGGVDFKFKNSSDYPVKVVAYTSGTTITVSIVGTPWSPAREVKLSHSTSTSGANTVVQSVRYVYSNGELIATDRLNSSTYMPHS